MTKREQRNRNKKAFANKVKAMSADERQAIADRFGVVTIEGRALSCFNCCMVWMQNPAATVVGGFKQWKKNGRAVRKGQHGMAIWVPIGSKNADGDIMEVDRCILGTVFDISQTDKLERERAA